MSHELLIEDLRQKAEEKTRAIWQEAETKVEKFRAEILRSLEQKKSQYDREQNLACEVLSKSLLTDAENKARKICTEAERVLADRLYALARELLKQLRGQGYEELFAALIEELPPHQWEDVRVNPADVSLAKRFFPQLQIVAEEDIIGGFEVIGDQGGVHIVNTLEKRLERAWPTIVPKLYLEIYQGMHADESAR